MSIALVEVRVTTHSMRRNLEGHALTLGQSLERAAEPLIVGDDRAKLQTLVDRFKDNEQLAGIVVTGADNSPIAVTKGLDQALASRGEGPVDPSHERDQQSAFFRERGGLFHILRMPISSGERIVGRLNLFHDARYIDARTQSIWSHALTGLAIQAFLIAAFVALIFNLAVRRPLKHLAVWLREIRSGTRTHIPAVKEWGSFGVEATRLASSLVEARAAAENEARLRDLAESKWTSERLRVFVRARLGGSKLFVVSNREPYEHWHSPEGITWTVPASGVVTALEPVLRAVDGTWIAQATGDADDETVDSYGRVRVPPDHPEYSLKRIWLSEREVKGFYLGFSNEGLWPLCNIVHTRPIFRREDWEQYQVVNERFAQAVLEEMDGEEDPVVLVQDYHFALLPRLIKSVRSDARIAIFWHVPWPNSEAFAICPWQSELLDGLLGADLIGFHLQAHCNNFLDTVDRAMESRILRENFGVERKGRTTLVRPFPISIVDNSDEEAAQSVESFEAEREKTLQALDIKAKYVGVGVDRIDYTKGIPEKFLAIERLLEKYPSYMEEIVFIQIGSPSRTELKKYQDLGKDLVELQTRINDRFKTPRWKPIHLLMRQHSHEELIPYYRCADFCFVNSLHDGMNLVSKEFVASRIDEDGALILSRFTGAAHELTDAVLVNPYDTEGTADAIRFALELDPEDRRARMRRMRAIVREANVYKWAGKLIETLCDIRPQQQTVNNTEAQYASYEAR